ncbi:hypothetical protein [Acidiferrimicrobium sp. IK]|uniref:hypothetical protein n=1 Tax=Acidiferrimicrobium sp. IK TaxID=2871700 RepID=UPI0021CB991F|nr:hypothetical protein [Acidiferrimicrobium sp. IK]
MQAFGFPLLEHLASVVEGSRAGEADRVQASRKAERPQVLREPARVAVVAHGGQATSQAV